MLYSELKTEVKTRVEQAIGSSTNVSDAQIATAIDNGYAELADSTEFHETHSTLTSTGALYEDLFDPSVITLSLLTLKAVWSPANNLWLDPTSQRDLDQENPTWERAAGNARKFLLRGLSWLGFYPRPAAGVDFEVYYTAIPAAMTQPSDYPLFPQEFHLGIACYAAFEILAVLGEGKKAVTQYVQFQEYEVGLAKFVKNRQSLDRVPGFGRTQNRPGIMEARP